PRGQVDHPAPVRLGLQRLPGNPLEDLDIAFVVHALGTYGSGPTASRVSGRSHGHRKLEPPNYRWHLMAVNADPKPGRWILPLVVLGMVAFTYFFVRALPSGSEEANGTDTTLSASDTTLANGEETPGDAPSTTAVAADPETQAYFEGLDTILATMEELQAEMSAVNSGFDADPRTVAYSDAVDRLTAL